MNHASQLDNGQKRLTPVEKVIRVFGAAKASAIAELTTDALRKWNRPVSKGGKGGLVPSRMQSRYLTKARDEGLDLTADDLIAEPVP